MNKTVLKKGERVVYYKQMTNIMVTKWKDKKDVVNDGETVVKRSGKDKSIPVVINI